jgi:CcmD family protein
MADSGIEYLYIAYTVIWLGWFVYLIYLHLKQSKIEKDIKNLEDMVKSRDRRRKK